MELEPIQYRKSIEMINKKNVLYDIFIFSNDFNPADDRSVYRQNKINKSENLKLRNNSVTWISRNLNRSFTYKKIKNLFREKILIKSKTKLFWEYYLKNITYENNLCRIIKTSFLR